MTRLLIISIGVVLVASGGGFLWYQVTTNPARVEEDPAIEAELAQLRFLKTIRFDTAILREEAFRSLVNPPPVPGLDSPLSPFGAATGTSSSLPLSGRQNPFLPF